MKLRHSARPKTITASSLPLLAASSLLLVIVAPPIRAQVDITYVPGQSDYSDYTLTGPNNTFTVGSGTADQYGVLCGTGLLTKAGAGTLTLAANNSFTGGTTLTDGTLAITGTLRGAVAGGDGVTFQIFSGGSLVSLSGEAGANNAYTTGYAQYTKTHGADGTPLHRPGTGRQCDIP